MPEDKKMSHKNKIGRSTFINLAGLLIPTFVSLITVPLYLRWIGEVRFGVLLLAFSLLGYLGAFDLGLGRAVAQRIANQETSDERNRTFWSAFYLSAGMGVLGGIILYFIGHWLFAEIFRMPASLRGEAQKAIFWLAAMVPMIAIISVLAGTLEARQAFLSLNVSQAVGVVSLQSFPLLSVTFGYRSISSLLVAALVGRLVGVLIMFLFTARKVPFIGWPTLHHTEIGPLLRFGGWVSVSGAVLPLLTIVDRIIIGAQLGAAAVTAYVVPYSLTQRLIYLPYALNVTLFPRFSQKKSKDSAGLLKHSIMVLAAIQFPFIVAAILLVHPFLVLWVGTKLALKMAPVAIILLLGIWVSGPAYPSYAFLQATGRPDLTTKVYLFQLVPFLAIIFALIEFFGIYGAAVAWSMRMLVDAVAWSHFSKTLPTFVKVTIKAFPSVVLASIIAGAPLKPWFGIPLLILIIISTLYFSIIMMPMELRHNVPFIKHFYPNPNA